MQHYAVCTQDVCNFSLKISTTCTSTDFEMLFWAVSKSWIKKNRFYHFIGGLKDGLNLKYLRSIRKMTSTIFQCEFVKALWVIFPVESLCLSVLLSMCLIVSAQYLLNCSKFIPNLVWLCIIMRLCVMQKNWFTIFSVKVTVRAYIIKIWLFLLYVLNCWSVCNQTWFGSTAS